MEKETKEKKVIEEKVEGEPTVCSFCGGTGIDPRVEGKPCPVCGVSKV